MRSIFKGTQYMSTTNPGRPRIPRASAAALASCLALVAGRALADDAPMATAPDGSTAAPTQPPSEIMAVNLIRLLVKQGVITQAAADSIIQQAQAETQQAQLASARQGPPPPPPGVIRVPYVPEVVRNQIRDDLKKEVLAQAQAEGWANPKVLPSWIDRVTWFGDFRFRDQFDLYDKNNIEPFIDYATLNANGPTDINFTTNPKGLPYLDTRNKRLDQLSLRARLGVNFDIIDGVALTVRLASGSDNSPVSTTQALGGGLAKKDIWLDQAFVTLKPVDWAALYLGRSPNEFMHTDILFDDNLNLDGVMATAEKGLFDPRLKLFGTAGAFPIGYVGANDPTNGQTKTPDSTKWLLAAQLGAKFQPDANSWFVRGAVAYYDFDNVAGKLSAPCDPTLVAQCSTDDSRPAFMQKGNTLFLIRDLVSNAGALNFAEPQFVGLAYDYRLVDATAELEAPLFDHVAGQIQADYVHNLAYDPGRFLANPLTPPVTNFDNSYRSGPNAFMVKGTIGDLHPENRGDWLISAGYKYIQPDAVLDAFNDHDFHLGGANAKGYILSGSYYFAHNSWLNGRWLAAKEVYGPPLTIDVLQLELNTRF